MATDAGCQMKVRALPQAKRTEIGGIRGDAIVVRLTTAPRKGAANKALCRFLAKTLGVRGSDVRIVSGEKSRDKIIHFASLSEAEVRRKLGIT
jgi:uncharacterized protein (TIGR00251 family)